MIVIVMHFFDNYFFYMKPTDYSKLVVVKGNKII